MPDTIIVQESNTQVVVTQQVAQLSATASGPQGPAGAGSAIQYNQSTPAATWTIVHNLGRPVFAEVFVGNQKVLTDTIITDSNTLTVVFASPQTGYVLYS